MDPPQFRRPGSRRRVLSASISAYSSGETLTDVVRPNGALDALYFPDTTPEHKIAQDDGYIALSHRSAASPPLIRALRFRWEINNGVETNANVPALLPGTLRMFRITYKIL